MELPTVLKPHSTDVLPMPDSFKRSFDKYPSSSVVQRFGFTLIELLVVIGIIGILLAISLPAVQAVREAARKTQCQNHLKQVGLALANYHSAFGRLPAAAIRPQGFVDNARDRPRATWAIAILPMIEQGPLYDLYDARFDTTADANRQFRETSVASYRCPSDPNGDVLFEPRSGARFSRSNYAANFGSASWGQRFWEDTAYRGVMGQNVGLRLTDIRDGTSQTVAVAEIRTQADYGDNRGVWAHPAAGASSVGLDCDKQCRGINDESHSDWIPYCTSMIGNNLECHSQNTEESNAGPRSLHPGGAFLLFCDGSVRFASEQISVEVLAAEFTSMNQEVIEAQ
ncbi:putative major pilin subunit [Allorhodopirellula solitaria]|uniref:Putative major pilin subunit n=2 Tax=Allorhodopirellula solitaria TaxID=2527987 RepID=A0A5C5YKA4_9BACT|nr:putative major pilin subunit [Allorhodopirellula solitaria]